MNTHANKSQENNVPSVFSIASPTQNQSTPEFQLVNNRPEAVVQRRLQELANNSAQSQQAAQWSRVANNAFKQQGFIRPPAHGSVAQMAFDKVIKPDSLNAIGEQHEKDEERRGQENQLAKSNNLLYMTEREYNYIVNDKVVWGDPIRLRISFALHSIKENIMALNAGSSPEPKKTLIAIQWALSHISDDLTTYVKDTKKTELLDHYEIMNKYLKALEPGKLAPSEALFAAEDAIDIISPDSKSNSSKISKLRSDAMHDAATKGYAMPVMWMIGQKHAEDIDKDFPKRNYTLLGKDEMEGNLKITESAKKSDKGKLDEYKHDSRIKEID